MSRLGIIFCCCSIVALIGYGRTREGSEDRVLKSDVQAITLYKGKMTTWRRVPAIPQIQCVGGSSYPSCYVPESAQCYNKGSDGKNPQWHCEAYMEFGYKFGYLEIDCEGYDHPNDPYMLEGSCGLKYSVELTRTELGRYQRCYKAALAMVITVIIVILKSMARSGKSGSGNNFSKVHSNNLFVDSDLRMHPGVSGFKYRPRSLDKGRSREPIVQAHHREHQPKTVRMSDPVGIGGLKLTSLEEEKSREHTNNVSLSMLHDYTKGLEVRMRNLSRCIAIDTRGIVQKLCEFGIISEDERFNFDSLESGAKSPNYSPIADLCQIVLSRGSSCYWMLLKSLLNTDQEEVASLLESPGIFTLRIDIPNINDKAEYEEMAMEAKKQIRSGNLNCSLLNLLEDCDITVLDVFHHCLMYVLKAPNKDALQQLWQMYKDGKLSMYRDGQIFRMECTTENPTVAIAKINEEEYNAVKDRLNVLHGLLYRGGKETIDSTATKVVDVLNPHLVIESLWSKRIINDTEKSELDKIPVTDEKEKTRILLKTLKSKDDFSFGWFILELDNLGQSHVANLFREGSVDPEELPMTVGHLGTLRGCHFNIIMKMTLESLIPGLQEEYVLDEFDLQRIEAKKVPWMKNKLFLDILRQKADRCFAAYGRCLCRDTQHAIAQELGLCDGIESCPYKYS